MDGWVDYRHLTGASVNHTSLTVTYRGCGNLPDSNEYGHVFRHGRSFVPDAPGKMVFRGIAFPYGDGTNAVASGDDFNVVIPLNNFVSAVIVARGTMVQTASYAIEFIDTLERTAPGTGVIFGFTSAANNDLAINQRVAINRQFTGTRAQRTIWARMKTGKTLVATETGDATKGGIYAEVL